MARKGSSVALVINVTRQEKKDIETRKEIRGFDTMSDYIRHIMALGVMVEDIVYEKPIRPEEISRALHIVAARAIEKGADLISTQDLEGKVRGTWQNYQKKLVTGKKWTTSTKK